jgi:hypothetical protein
MIGGEISGNGGAGVQLYGTTGCSFTMSGGVIKNNSLRGITAGNNTIIMTGGTIENNGNGTIHGRGIYMTASTKFSINGPVDIKDTIGMLAGATHTAPIIYLGNLFNPIATIIINIGGNTTNFAATWISDNTAKPILKSGTSENPTAITEGQWNTWGSKFSMGKAYTFTSTNGVDAVERTDGTFVLTRTGDPAFGYAQWMPAQ